MAKDIFVLVQFNKSTGLFDIKYFNDAVDTKQFTTDLIPAEPDSDIVLSSFFVNTDKKKISKPDIKFFRKPHPIVGSKTNFGLLYNGRTVKNYIDIALNNFRLPTNADFNNLINHYSTVQLACNALIDSNQLFWNSIPNSIDNSSGLSIRGAGSRNFLGAFENFKNLACFWSSNYPDQANQYYYYFNPTTHTISQNTEDMRTGFAIRLCKPNSTLQEGQKGIYTDLEGFKYETVCINGIEWMTSNLKTTKFSDGSDIILCPSSNAWNQTNQFYYCYPNNDFANV
jgi:uncharacterized protein (TIGR02145 family)